MSSNPAEEYAAKLKREQEENPIQIEHLDGNVRDALPNGLEIVSIIPSGASAYCQTIRIDGRLHDGSTAKYFLKSQSGEVGRRMMEGAYQSESTYHRFCPDHVPKPIAWGPYNEDCDKWFYLCEFHDMIDELPDVKDFVSIIAKVHRDSMGKSPTEKYGFEVPTHLANVPNDNTWQGSWEVWFTRAMVVMFDFEKRTQGEDEGFESLFEKLRAKVIPRLLRPLETGGRSIEPCLIHSDLWPGNVKPDADTGRIMIFDSCAYWGHNESDLASWRAPRYHLGEPYLEEYRRVMGMCEPCEDWDDRNALYAVRYDLLLSGLYPSEPKFRQRAKQEMEALVDKYHDGYLCSEDGEGARPG